MHAATAELTPSGDLVARAQREGRRRLRTRRQVTVIGTFAALAVVGLTSAYLNSGRTPDPVATPASPTPSTSASVSVACPPKAPAIKQVNDASPGSLAPADSTHGVMCVYAGLNEKVAVGTLTGVISVPDPSGLARALNEATPVTGIYNCPNDDAGIDAVVLSRRSGAPAIIEVSRTGCQFASSTLTKSGYHLSPAGFAALRHLDPTFPR